MIVVSDTSPIRALFHIDLISVIPALFGEVLVPPAVADELRHAGPRWRAIEVARFSGISVLAPGNAALVAELAESLDRGESEAIALALERHANAILIDESAGRAVARSRGITAVGTLGILERAKLRGDIASALPLVDRLVSEINFFVSQSLREEFRRRVGE